MQYFTSEFNGFFKDLAANNHKEWFHANKKRYEQHVKNPFYAFLTALIAEIQKHDPSVQVEPKDCVSRINRDIRFSKDKTPYNLHFTAFISTGGRKDKSIPGIFLRFSPEMVGIMIGAFGPDKEQLASIRTSIIKHQSKFSKLINNADFVDKFGEIKGDKMKRIPKDLVADVEKEPLILHKQYYFVAEKDPSLLTSEKLLDEVMEYWHTGRPVNEFLKQSMIKNP